MKLKKITIHNLASIEHAVIDFTLPPLSDDPIFLISGPTGAGKSTILDAVCLALFAETPRFYRVREKSVSYTMEYRANEKGQSVSKEMMVSLDDKRQVMRRGTGECYAALVFSTEDDDYYEAKWYVRKAHRRTDGQYQKAEHTLTNLRTGFTVVKGTVAAIEELIHLKFDEFCRTTLLAQGEFTKFIQSNSDDKSQILEKLTGTGIYSDISKKIAEIRSSKQAALERAKDLLGNITILDDEDLEKNRQEKERVEQSCVLLKKQVDDYGNAIQWLTSWADLLKRQQETQEKIIVNHDFRQQPSYLEEEQRIRQFWLSAEARAWLQEADALQQKITEDRGLENAFANRYDRLSAIHDAILQLQVNDSHSLQSSKTDLEAYLPHTEMLEHAQALVLVLGNADSSRKKAAGLKEKIQDSKSQMPSEEALREAMARHEEAKAAVTAKQQEVDQAERELQALHPEQLEEDRMKNQSRSELISQTMADLRVFEAKQKNLEEKKERLSSLKEQLAQLQAAIPKLVDDVKNAEKTVAEDKRLYDQVKDSAGKVFMDVRHLLRSGDHCPLCRQRIEMDQVPDPDYDVVIKPLRQRYEQSDSRLTDCKSAVLSANRQAELKGNECEAASVEVEKATKDTEKHLKALRGKLGQLKPACADEDIAVEAMSALLLGWQRETETEGIVIREAQRKVDAANSHIRSLTKEKDRLLKIQQDMSDALQQLQQRRDRLTQAIANYSEQLSQEEANARRLLDEAGEQMSYADWRQEWEQDVQSLTRRIREDADRFNALRKQITDIEAGMALRQEVIGNSGAHKSAILQVMPSWENRLPLSAYTPTKQETARPAPLWQQFHADLVAWQERLEQNGRKVAQHRRQVALFCEENPLFSEDSLRALSAFTLHDIDNLGRNHEKVEREAVALKSQLDGLKEDQERMAAEKPLLLAEKDDMDVLKREKEELVQRHDEAWRKQGQLQQLLQTDAENRRRQADALVQRDEAERENNKWNTFSNLFGSTDGNRFRRIAQSFILNHLLIKANYYLSRFTDRFELVAEPGSLVILVSDRYTRQPPQYVKVLSGGESFMVSLALALALSQLNDTPCHVDTLFIDEGFGTLDSDCLGSVVETLSRLHEMGGRRVGIISHVEELRHNIATQIRVRKTDPTRSKVEVLSQGM